MIFTGAQKAADDPASDGPRNLTDALTAAAAPASRAMGVMVLFEQHLHAARDVTKAHTSRVDAFRSASHGKLGEVDGEGEFAIVRRAGDVDLEPGRIARVRVVAPLGR